MEQICNVIELGFCDTMERLRNTSSEKDYNRELIEQMSVSDASQKYDNFCRHFIFTGQTKGAHVLVYRTALQQLDDDMDNTLSASTSPMWRFTWAQLEAQKMSDVVQFALKTVKRSGVPRHDWLARLQVVYRSIHGTGPQCSDEDCDEEFPQFPAGDESGCESEHHEVSASEEESMAPPIEEIFVESSGEENSATLVPPRRRYRSKQPQTDAPPPTAAQSSPDLNIIDACLRNATESMSKGMFNHVEHKDMLKAKKREQKAERLVKHAQATLRRLGHVVDGPNKMIKKGKQARQVKTIKKNNSKHTRTHTHTHTHTHNHNRAHINTHAHTDNLQQATTPCGGRIRDLWLVRPSR